MRKKRYALVSREDEFAGEECQSRGLLKDWENWRMSICRLWPDGFGVIMV